MTSFLLTISLLLNGITIYFIFILFSRQNRLLEVEKTQEKFKKDIENEISAFLFEMKEENEVFIKRFHQVNREPFLQQVSSDTPKPEQKNELHKNDMFDQIDETFTRDLEATAGQAMKKQAVKVYQKTIASHGEYQSATEENDRQPENKSETPKMGNEEIYRDLLINRIRIMQNQGHSIDEIAQKLNKGKTEIELLLKFG